MHFHILYEDEFLIVIDKPPGFVVQRGYDADEPVVYEELARQLSERGSELFLLQRLDRGTTGAILFTKRSEANPRMTRLFERKRIRKHYVALVHGPLRCAQTIEAPLARIGPISFGVRDGGKRAITHVRPRLASSRASMIDLDLETGRTHQIRVHMAAIGHPLVGDWLYGARDAARPMLHAASLTLPHPMTQQELVIEAPIPDDFAEEARSRGIEL